MSDYEKIALVLMVLGIVVGVTGVAVLVALARALVAPAPEPEPEPEPVKPGPGFVGIQRPTSQVVTDDFAWWSTSSGSDQGQLAAVMTVNKGGTGAPRFTASLTGTAPNLTGPVALALVYPTRRPANDCWIWDGTAEQPASVLLWDGSTEIPTTLEVAP